jgi:hypothetical protein
MTRDRKSVARKLRFALGFQADLGRPVPLAKTIRFCRRANQFYQLAPSHPQEGRIAIVTNAGWDAVDAAALGARDDRRAGFL